jgi:hypothetical protein
MRHDAQEQEPFVVGAMLRRAGQSAAIVDLRNSGGWDFT